MFDAMERGELKALYVIGENPLQSEADQHRATKLIEGLDFLVVQDIFLTETAQRADVVFPAAAGAFESEGTVTNSERRVQRVRKTIEPPGEAREDLKIIVDLARKLGHDWPDDAESMWNEVRQLSPWHAGMSYRRLEAARRPALAVLRRSAPRRDLPARATVGAADQGAARAVLDRSARAAAR